MLGWTLVLLAASAVDALIEPGFGEQTVRLNEQVLRVEVADRPRLWRQGLMHRRSLADDRGMLFVYPDERALRFWMKDTPIDLDIGFYAADGRCVGQARMRANDLAEHVSPQPARYALELAAGWFARHLAGDCGQLRLGLAIGRVSD